MPGRAMVVAIAYLFQQTLNNHAYRNCLLLFYILGLFRHCCLSSELLITMFRKVGVFSLYNMCNVPCY